MASQTGNRVAIQIAGFGLIFVAGVLAWLFLPVAEWVQRLSEWIQGRGAIGVTVFGVVYVIAVILLAPSWPLTVAAGLIFGFWGIPIVVVSATLGASAAFFLARYGLRKRVASWVQQRPKLQAVDRAIEQQGAKIVILLRLSPAVPFNLQNYFFGVTKIRSASYIVATLFGIIPGTGLYVYLGTLGQVAATGNGLDGPRLALLTVGLFATVAAVVLIARKAKQALTEASH